MTNAERRSQTHLTCSSCNETKPIEEYYAGNLWWCKLCIRTASANYSAVSEVKQSSKNINGSRKEYYMGRYQEKVQAKDAELTAVKDKIARMQSYISGVQQEEYTRPSAVNYAEQKLTQKGDYWIWI